jgi:hypothetical protein
MERLQNLAGLAVLVNLHKVRGDGRREYCQKPMPRSTTPIAMMRPRRCVYLEVAVAAGGDGEDGPPPSIPERLEITRAHSGLRGTSDRFLAGFPGGDD